MRKKVRGGEVFEWNEKRENKAGCGRKMPGFREKKKRVKIF